MLEKHEVELWSEMLGWNKSWREMNWHQRLSALTGVVCGFGDDIVTMLASQIKLSKVKWLWPNRIPLGKLTLFVGDPDNGKSMMTAYVTATVTTGRAWYDEKNSMPKGDVLIFANEDDAADTAVPRLKAAGADLERVRFGNIGVNADKQVPQQQREMQLDKDIQTIKKFLDRSPTIRLVVIDPVSNYLGAAEMNKEQDVRRVLTPLQRLASETGVAILGVMHLNKKGDQQGIHRIGGAMAFVGVARAVWLFARDLEDHRVFHMLGVKKNIGERVSGLKYEIATKPVKIEGEDVLESYVEWLGQSNKSVDDILPLKPVGRPKSERNEASEWLKQFLSKGAKPSTEVAAAGEAAGFHYRTLERVKDQRDSFVEAFRKDGKWFWKLDPFAVFPEREGGEQDPEGQRCQNL